MTVTDGANGAIIVWQDDRNGQWDIYAQHVDATGNPCWTTDGVPVCISTGQKSTIRAVTDGLGGVFVVWDDDRSFPGSWDVYIQHMNAAGVPMLATNGQLLLPPSPGLERSSPDAAPFRNGVLVTWSNNGDIYATVIDPNGSPNYWWPAGGMPVCTASGTQDLPRVCITPSSSDWPYAVFTWVDGRQGGAFVFDLYAQQIDINTGQNHTPLWTTNGVRLTPTSYLNRPHQGMAADGDAGAIISWEEYGIGNSSVLHAQRVPTTGTLAWGSGGIRLSNAPGSQGAHDILADGSGGAFIAWGDTRGDSSDIYAQHLDALGNALWVRDGLAVCSEPHIQSGPRVVSDGAGGAIVTWTDNRNTNRNMTYARGISADGVLHGPSGSLRVSASPNAQGWSSMVASSPGSAVVSWGEIQPQNNKADIYANLITVGGVTTPGIAQSYFVPQSGSLTTPTEGSAAIANFRTCPNIDGTQVLRQNARLKVVLRTEDSTPLARVTPDNICIVFNGGTPAQGFHGAGDDSIIANNFFNPLAGCPDVRCITADAATDSAGATFITIMGCVPGSPGVARRDPARKFGGWAGDVPVFALATPLQGRLTSNGVNGSYTFHVKAFDHQGGRTLTKNQGELVNGLDINPVQAAIGGPYKYNFDFDNNSVVNSLDLNLIKSHQDDNCNSPLDDRLP